MLRTKELIQVGSSCLEEGGLPSLYTHLEYLSTEFLCSTLQEQYQHQC